MFVLELGVVIETGCSSTSHKKIQTSAYWNINLVTSYSLLDSVSSV